MSRKAILILAFLLFLFCFQYPRFRQNEVKASDGYPVRNLSTGLNYTNIQEAVNAADNGDEILVNQGTYYENVVLNKSLSITGEDSENTIVDGGTGDFTFLVTADNATISRFTIKAAQHLESGPTHVGVMLDAVTNCTLSWNLITGGDQGIALDAASQNFIVQNNITENHFAIVLSQARANTIRENNFWNDGIAVWLTQSSDENLVNQNFMTQTSGVQVAGSIGNVIAANNFTDNTPGVELDQSSNTTIDSNLFVHDGIFIGYDSITYGNTVKNNLVNGKPLVYLEGASNCTIEDAGQVIVVNSTGIRLDGLNISDTTIGAELTNSDNIQITRCDLSNNKINGLALTKTTNSSVTWNQLKANGGNGLNIYLSQWNDVTENSLTDNEFGISCSSSTTISLIDNNLTANRQEGIQLVNSGSCQISGNTVSGNSYGGIWLLTSSNNTITKNNIISNFRWTGYMGIGIRLIFSSNNNNIYHNNIAGNNVQATVEVQSEGNIWDDGYPSGGNYWGDLNGTDVSSGPYQNETGSNAIADKPYIIDTNNPDHFPLMGTFQSFNVSAWNVGPSVFEEVDVVSNVSVSTLDLLIWLTSSNQYIQAGQAFIRLTPVQEQNITSGFCRMILPNNILNASDYTVLVDMVPVSVTRLATSNHTHTTLYITFNPSAKGDIIIVPEFPFLLIPVFMTATLIAVIHTRKNPQRRCQCTRHPSLDYCSSKTPQESTNHPQTTTASFYN